jgi:hypothetical protein
MVDETLRVPRAPFEMEEPWVTPEVCGVERLRSALDGAAPRLSTTFAVWYDDDYLTILYSAADDHVVATMFAHDAPLYDEDVVEAFIAPESLEVYYEIEVSPRGTIFDARVESPDGHRATMHVDRGWTCDGMVVAVRRTIESDGVVTIDTLVRIPFQALGRTTPLAGECWRANFFRIDRHPTAGSEFSAWQPTLATPADFHVPAAFGTLCFDV